MVLLRVWFALPAALLPRRCALTAPFHPYPHSKMRAVYFLWHFPSNGLEPALPDVIRHTALWSSDFPLPHRRRFRQRRESDRPVQLPTRSLYMVGIPHPGSGGRSGPRIKLSPAATGFAGRLNFAKGQQFARPEAGELDRRNASGSRNHAHHRSHPNRLPVAVVEQAAVSADAAGRGDWSRGGDRRGHLCFRHQRLCRAEDFQSGRGRFLRLQSLSRHYKRRSLSGGGKTQRSHHGGLPGGGRSLPPL